MAVTRTGLDTLRVFAFQAVAAMVPGKDASIIAVLALCLCAVVVNLDTPIRHTAFQAAAALVVVLQVHVTVVAYLLAVRDASTLRRSGKVSATQGATASVVFSAVAAFRDTITADCNSGARRILTPQGATALVVYLAVVAFVMAYVLASTRIPNAVQAGAALVV